MFTFRKESAFRASELGRIEPVPLYSAIKHPVGLLHYQYVLSERISVAKEMLSKRDLSIADVALAVGFSDASQLNRVFGKFIGVTPTAFRRENGVSCIRS